MTEPVANPTSNPRAKRSFWDFAWKWAAEDADKITQEEIDYFRDHPDEIDDFASPIRMHKLFLLIGMTLGVLFVGVTRLLEHSGVLAALPAGLTAFLTDIVFEVGAALIGASIVTFMMGIVMNQQQKSALKWRDDIRERIREAEEREG